MRHDNSFNLVLDFASHAEVSVVVKIRFTGSLSSWAVTNPDVYYYWL